MNKFSQFTYRHIGSSIEDQNSMLQEINCNSLEDLLNSTLPKNILIKEKLNIETIDTEIDYEANLRRLHSLIRVSISFFVIAITNF